MPNPNCDPVAPIATTIEEAGNTANFQWTAQGHPIDRDNKYEGRLDGGEWVNYTVDGEKYGAVAYTDLEDGAHVFEARVVNQCGVPSTSAYRREWTSPT